MQYKPSNYNHAVKYGNKVLLFNGVSSAMVMLEPDTYQALRPYVFASSPVGDLSDSTVRFRPALLTPGEGTFEMDTLSDSTLTASLDDLIRGKFIVRHDLNELELLKRRYQENQENDPLLVMVTTTMECNLGCYYCYEDKHPSYLSDETCDRIFDHIRRDLRKRPQKRMHLSWFGGEPMLNRKAIDYLSALVIPFCDSVGTKYTSSMVSNGTVWPEDAANFLTRNRIGSVQFSFDGLSANHNNRRHYIDGNSRHEISSFEALCSTVGKLVGYARIYLRMNLDRGNQKDAFALVEMFHTKGWLFPGSKVYPYLASLGPYTEACQSVTKTAVDLTEFDLLNNQFREFLSQYVDIREFPTGYYPKSMQLSCSAVADHSVIFGPDGAMYKCPHDLGLHVNSHGDVHGLEPEKASTNLFPILALPSTPQNDYTAYDPFSHDTCKECRYLPICLGGCPKVQMEQQEYYLASTCKQWENSFEQMLRTFADTATRPTFPLAARADLPPAEIRAELRALAI